MRIGLVCPYDLSKPGGVQGQVLGLSKTLQSMGDEVVVIGPGLPGQVKGIDLGRTVSIRANRSMVPISVDPRVGRVIRAAGADVEVLHVHEPFMPMVSLLALRSGPPVVATFHAAPGRMGKGLYRLAGRRIQSLLGGNVRRITAVSSAAAASLPVDLGVSIVPNGVDVGGFSVDAPRERGKVVFLGRDEPRKGLGVLLRAWGQIKGAVPHAELVALGPNRGTPGVRWMGRVDEETKRRELSSAEIYVAPNTGGESFGVVLIEAMAAGVTVVASDLTAFVEAGGEGARFFETGSPDALAKAVIELLTDEERRRDLASRGRERALTYDWGRVAAAYRSLYLASCS